MVRRVTGALGGRAVFGALAAELAVERDARFAAALAQALNLILLTAPEACPSSLTQARAMASAWWVDMPWTRLSAVSAYLLLEGKELRRYARANVTWHLPI